MKYSELKKERWFRFLSNKYVFVLLLFLVWMFFFDTNNWFIHEELDDDVEALEENIEHYKEEIMLDKKFLDKMKDSTEMEKFARENYYLKRENEDIFIIEHEDSIK